MEDGIKNQIFFLIEINLFQSKIMLCTLLCFTTFKSFDVLNVDLTIDIWLSHLSVRSDLLSRPHLQPPLRPPQMPLYTVCLLYVLFTPPLTTLDPDNDYDQSQKIDDAWCYSPISIHLCLAVCCLECQYFQCLSWSSLLFSSPNTTITTLWKKHFITLKEVF